jgi:RNA polymerase sigma-70 factor (ECF subfamily)
MAEIIPGGPINHRRPVAGGTRMARGHDAASDSTLVDALGDRSPEALREIYRRHGGAVWSVASQVCRKPEHVEYVCEAVFSELWSHPGRFDPARNQLRAWLVARAHACAADLARSARPRRTPKSSAAKDVAELVERLGPRARRALQKLPPAERDAILLAYVGGRTHGEAARVLGTLDAAVKRRIRDGLLSLRHALEAEGVKR